MDPLIRTVPDWDNPGMIPRVARMGVVCPDLAAVTAPSIGHALTLTEPPALAATRAFLEQIQ